MSTIPKRTPDRRTLGSKRLGVYLDKNGLRAVTVYIPTPLHRALSIIAIESETSIQALITAACQTFYGTHQGVPPLAAATRTKTDPHKTLSWYADIALHKRMKLLAVDIDGTVQQLIISAILEYLKDSPHIRKLHMDTGYAPYARAPVLAAGTSPK